MKVIGGKLLLKNNSCIFLHKTGQLNCRPPDKLLDAGQQRLLMADEWVSIKCGAFRTAASKGYVNILRLLWKFAGNDFELKKHLLTAFDCRSFKEATQNSQYDALALLWGFACSNKKLMEYVCQNEGFQELPKLTRYKFFNRDLENKFSGFFCTTFFKPQSISITTTDTPILTHDYASMQKKRKR